MRRLVLLWFLSCMPVLAHGQVGVPELVFTNLNPPTVCSSTKMYINIAANKTWISNGSGGCQQNNVSGGGGGDALTSNPLSQFASTTSAQLAGVITNETGTGVLVFGTSPNITTPTGIVKGDVGLGNVDNTSDATKNAASVTLTNKTIDGDSNTIQDLAANTVFKSGTNIPTAIIVTGSVTNSRCLRLDGSGNIVVHSSDCGSGGGGGASTALDNLASVAINTDLIFAVNTSGIEFGTSSQNILDYVNGTGPRFSDGMTGNFLRFNVQSLAADRTFTWPNRSATVATTTGTLTNGRCVEIDASGNFIQSAAACNSGGGIGGTVGSTDNAIPRADGTGGATLQSSGVTIDDSNNIFTAGSISSGVGGSVAGTLDLGEGSAPLLVANQFSIYAPVDVAAGGLAYVLPTAAATGFMLATNSGGVHTISHVAFTGTGNVARVTDAVFDTSLQIPNGAAPSTDAFGEIAGDNNAWASGRGAPQWFDGTANTYLVGALASDTPSNGQVPTWNTGGTITWETPSGGGANTALSNLASVAINTTLVSDTDNTDDLGTNSIRWRNLFLSGFIGDGSGNELLKLSPTASAVNEFTVANAATGNGPTLSATGGDTNIDINLTPKGTGGVVVAGSSDATITATNTNGSVSLVPNGTGGIIINGGTKITKYLSATATLDFGNLVTMGCSDLTITVTGAADGDTVAIGVPNGSMVANSTFTGWVSAADTVTVRFCALVSGNPASGTFRATVIKH